MAEELNIRRIRKSEIGKAAKNMAESFYDYPLFVAFFPNEKTRLKLMTSYFTVSLYARRDYTYVTEDLAFVGCIKYPEDKAHSLFLSFLNPYNFFRCLPIGNPKYYILFGKFNKAMEETRKKYYDPKKDVYVEAVCIASDARAKKSVFRLFRDNYQGQSVYCETADPRLVRLYRLMGFEEKESVVWQDLTNVMMKHTAEEKPSVEKEKTNE